MVTGEAVPIASPVANWVAVSDWGWFSADGGPDVLWTRPGWGEYEWECPELAFRFKLTWVVGVETMAFSLLMGFLGGFVPAWRAGQLSIIECLRQA